ncbi:hypothetical protein Vafri_13648 [Volvox africanus]|uniref:Uncharacterized protein n=1 Tax=Volvox africanus TaxID=51714 RepID=A0A8J4BCI1_9CHLO|nr:hypothetical protein Vafri_13648 [Volvox africanus]
MYEHGPVARCTCCGSCLQNLYGRVARTSLSAPPFCKLPFLQTACSMPEEASFFSHFSLLLLCGSTGVHWSNVRLCPGRQLRSLAKELRREAATYEALHARLSAWRSYSCRSVVFSGGAQLGLPGLSWQGESQQHGDRRRAAGIAGIHKEDVEGGGPRGDGDKDGDSLKWGSSRTGSSEQVLWSWTMQVYTPAWMSDEEGFDPPPPRGEAPGDRDDDDEDEDEGDSKDESELGKSGEGDIGKFLSEVRPLLEDALSRW